MYLKPREKRNDKMEKVSASIPESHPVRKATSGDVRCSRCARSTRHKKRLRIADIAVWVLFDLCSKYILISDRYYIFYYYIRVCIRTHILLLRISDGTIFSPSPTVRRCFIVASWVVYTSFRDYLFWWDSLLVCCCTWLCVSFYT